MTILAWIVLGLVAGAIAKALMPGRDPGGIIVTMLVGIVGAFLGGFLGNTDHRVRTEWLFALEHRPGRRRRNAATLDLPADYENTLHDLTHDARKPRVPFVGARGSAL